MGALNAGINKLSCRRHRATLRVIEYFAKSPKVIRINTVEQDVTLSPY